MRLPDTLSSLHMLSPLEHHGWIYPLFQWMSRHKEPDGSPSLTHIREMVLCTFASYLPPVNMYLTSHCAGLRRFYLVLGRDFFFQQGLLAYASTVTFTLRFWDFVPDAEKLICLDQLPSLQLIALSGHAPEKRPRLARFAHCLHHLRASHLETVGFDICVGDLENGDLEVFLPLVDILFTSQVTIPEENAISETARFPRLQNVIVNLFVSASGPSGEMDVMSSSEEQILKEWVERSMPRCRESGLLIMKALCEDAEKVFLRRDIKSYYDKLLLSRQ
ncbi:hypothetical protein K435DRAFT_521631 [Dendrothele bispora CBS 962.96]|uniref:Uncharacterized protein n=1 Tax=Dendrothele bispora (strain CBS 962.96) TaxID=1314807 RepID=A0A4S8MA48_DENBC|nr:hypothetical protein K435DRAFT_521631 [Dendrothele bispora CBS 962.96]